MHSRIKTKLPRLSIGGGVFIAIFLIIGLVTIAMITNIRTQMQTIINQRGPASEAAYEMEINLIGTGLFANDAAEKVLKSWNTALSAEVPERWQKIILKALETDSSGLEEDMVAERVLSFGISPVKGAGYVNLYARDITERKRTKEIRS